MQEILIRTIGKVFVAIAVVAGIAAARAATIVFPNDGISHQIDLVRHYTSSGTLVSSAGAIYSGNSSQYLSNAAVGAINGHLSDSPWRFKSDIGYPNSAAQAVLVVDLGDQYDINRIRTLWSGDVDSYSLRVSPDNATWTTVVSPVNPVANANLTDTFAVVSARYVELTATGLVSAQAGLNELFVYPAASSPSPRTDAGFDLGYLVNSGQASVTLNSNWSSGSTGNNLLGGSVGTIRPQSIVAGQDAIAVIDLGEAFELYHINLIFGVGGNKDWPNGGKVEIGLTNAATYDTTLLDISTSLTHSTLQFAPQFARYVRITAYDPPAAAGSHLQSVEIFASGVIPEPASAVLLALAGLAAMRRRRS